MVAVALRSRRDGCDGAGHDRDVVVGAAVRCCFHGRLAETTDNIVVIIAFVGLAIVLVLVVVLLLSLFLFSFLLVMRQSADGSEGIDEKGQGEDLREDGRHDDA